MLVDDIVVDNIFLQGPSNTIGLTDHIIVNKGCVLKLDELQSATPVAITYYPFAK